eukprot:4346581-Prymnesium_polylepis.1
MPSAALSAALSAAMSPLSASSPRSLSLSQVPLAVARRAGIAHALSLALARPRQAAVQGGRADRRRGPQRPPLAAARPAARVRVRCEPRVPGERRPRARAQRAAAAGGRLATHREDARK